MAGDLLNIKNEALRWLDVCRAMLGELTEVRYKSRSAGEQLRAEVALWERALGRCARICADLVRLGIEERILRVNTTVTERDTDTLITGTLSDLGHNPRPGRHSRSRSRNMRTAQAATTY